MAKKTAMGMCPECKTKNPRLAWGRVHFCDKCGAMLLRELPPRKRSKR